MADIHCALRLSSSYRRWPILRLTHYFLLALKEPNKVEEALIRIRFYHPALSLSALMTVP